MTGAGMLFVLLRGVNLTEGFLSKTSLYLAVKVSFRVVREQMLKILYFQFVLFTRFMKSKFKMVSLRGQKKVGPRPDWSPFRGVNSKFPTSFPAPLLWEFPQSLLSPDRALTILLLFIP